MGLKSNYYTSKSTGVVLPNAYAILTNLILESDNRVRAIFSIQASREYVKNYKPLDRVEVKFDWDRKTDLSTMAYTKAKEQVLTFEEYNEQTGEVVERTEYGTLYGWQDDIV